MDDSVGRFITYSGIKGKPLKEDGKDLYQNVHSNLVVWVEIGFHSCAVFDPGVYKRRGFKSRSLTKFCF